MFKEVKEIMLKEEKQCMITMLHQPDNINEDIEVILIKYFLYLNFEISVQILPSLLILHDHPVKNSTPLSTLSFIC